MSIIIPASIFHVFLHQNNDIFFRSPNIFVENDKFTFHRNPVPQSTDGIRGKVGYERGMHVFEINWPTNQRGSHAIVGVSPGKNKD